MWTVSVFNGAVSMKRIVLVMMLVLSYACAVPYTSSAQDLGIGNEVLDALEYDTDAEYYVRLINGDVVTGQIVEITSDSSGSFLRIATSFGRARLYAREIAWIGTRESSYRARHRGILLPTAQPIGNDHYLALVEGVMPTIGVGIGSVLSITAGRTVVPGIGWSNQFSTVNVKGTVYEGSNGLVEQGKQVYALGVNGAWVNDVNFIGHLYGVATFTGKRTSVSTLVHAKIAGKDDYTVSGGTLFGQFRFPYTNGTIGVALMMDVRFPELHDLHFVGELWNADLRRPSNSALFVGVRQGNTALTFDFGIAVLPGPNVAPAFVVQWTPF